MGQPDVVQISRTAREKEAEAEPVRQEDAKKAEGASARRAVLVLDEERNVVVQVLDEEGKVVRQMPPEEYVDMMKQLKELSSQLFHVEV